MKSPIPAFLGGVIFGVVILALYQWATAVDPKASVKDPIRLTPNDFVWTTNPIVKVTMLEGDPQASGVLFTFRSDEPDNLIIPPHYHPADEHIDVISGIFNVGFGDVFDKTNTKPYPAGSFIVIPAGKHHFAWTKGRTIIQIHAIGPWGMTYVNPADQSHVGADMPDMPTMK